MKKNKGIKVNKADRTTYCLKALKQEFIEDEQNKHTKTTNYLVSHTDQVTGHMQMTKMQSKKWRS